MFSALDREMILTLLEKYQLPFRITYKRRKGKLALMIELIVRTLVTLQIARSFRADIFISIGNPTVGIPAWLMGKPYVTLTDTEHAVEQHILFKPFATVIATPSSFRGDLGEKHVRYDGYHELAYLHPDVFKPDLRELEGLGIDLDSRFFVVRFVSWQATHDIGQHGFKLEQKRELLRELSNYGQIFLSVEGEVDPEFSSYVTQFSPEKIHHLLAFADLYVGEGATMAAEAAILGTPTIFVSTLRMGNFLDLQDSYELLFCYTSGQEAIDKISELLLDPELKAVWDRRKSRLLDDKIRVTPWLNEMYLKALNDV